jgi:hypothetical protein
MVWLKKNQCDFFKKILRCQHIGFIGLHCLSNQIRDLGDGLHHMLFMII